MLVTNIKWLYDSATVNWLLDERVDTKTASELLGISEHDFVETPYNDRIKFVDKAFDTDHNFADKVINTTNLNLPTEVEVPNDTEYIEEYLTDKYQSFSVKSCEY